MEFALNKMSSIENLIAIIENSNNNIERLESIRNLSNILGNSDKLFKILENLLISDSDEEIRCLAAEVLGKNFCEKLFEPLIWAIQHESSSRCLNIVFSSLIYHMEHLDELIDQDVTSKLLEYINNITDKEFKIALKSLFEKTSFQKMQFDELNDLLFNFISLSYLKKKFWRLKYKIEDLKVIKIDFIFKGLTEIPEPIRYLKSLKELSLKYNQITILPDWCGTLTSLERLDLSQNRINKLPNSIKHLQSLKILNLEGNELSFISDSISSLNSLEILNIKSNSIEQIPKSLASLKTLRELHVGAYSLVNIPDVIKDMEKRDLKIFFESI